MNDVTMALRDASWFDRPNVRSVKVYHVATPDMVAACNSRVLLAEFTGRPVDDVRPDLRCVRLACANRWRAASRK